MSPSTLIDGFVAFVARTATANRALAENPAMGRDQPQTAWQRELGRAHDQAAPKKANPPRDVLASFASTFDPLLLRAAPGQSPASNGGQAAATDSPPAHRTPRSAGTVQANDQARVAATGRERGTGPAAAASSTSANSRSNDAALTRSQRQASSAKTDAEPPLEIAASTAADRAPKLGGPNVAGGSVAMPLHALPRTWSFMAGSWAVDPNADKASSTAASTDEPTPTSARISDAISGALQAHAPIRLHVEWSETGARVWLGLDADNTANAAQIIESVQQCLSRSGARLRSVVCNGADVPLGKTTDDSANHISREITDRIANGNGNGFAPQMADGAIPDSAPRAPFPIDLHIERKPSWPPSAP